MLSRSRKFVILSLITLASFQGSAAAETAGAPDPAAMAQKITERMKSDLGLSDDQVSQVQQIFTDTQSRLQEERQARLEARRQKRNEVQDKIGAVLTEEQKAKYEEILKQRQEHRESRRGKRFEKFQEWKEKRREGRGDGWGRRNHEGFRDRLDRGSSEHRGGWGPYGGERE